MPAETWRGTRLVLLFTIVCSVGLVGVMLASNADHRRGDDFWSALRFEADEVEGYSSLAQMRDASDSVVVGRFVDVGLSRLVQGDAKEDVVAYAGVTLQVLRLVAGRGIGTVHLEFILPGGPGDADQTVQALRASLPTTHVVAFLREKKGPQEEGIYRLVNFSGLWTATDRREVDTPLSAEPPDVDRWPELTEIGSLEDFILLLSSS